MTEFRVSPLRPRQRSFAEIKKEMKPFFQDVGLIRVTGRGQRNNSTMKK